MILREDLDPAVAQLHAEHRAKHGELPSAAELVYELRAQFKYLVRPPHLRASLERQRLKVREFVADKDADAESRLKAARAAENIEAPQREYSAAELAKLSPVARLQLAKRNTRRASGQ